MEPCLSASPTASPQGSTDPNGYLRPVWESPFVQSKNSEPFREQLARDFAADALICACDSNGLLVAHYPNGTSR
jgi:hypothetical protein